MEWDPTRFFRDDPDMQSPYALLILNQPINEEAYLVLQKHACFTICADGGANRFYDMMQARDRESLDLPNAIVGDLDSIRPAVRQHYEALDVPVIENPDQYSTDFTKCLRYLEGEEHLTRTHREKGLDIVVLGGLGGRVDQAFSQIHHLYAATMEMECTRNHQSVARSLYLVSEESVTFILKSGRNMIYTGSHNDTTDQAGGRYFEENIGIIPLAGPTRITTHGLEWDVTDWPTQIGGQLSTSNHIRASVVEIETAAPVLFTAELAARFKFGGRAR
ncbi:hypothetical protein ASPZODRAFT_166286 [Penicilliopsis zonata CBS 506.65]|uniref:Thiamine pyrophosphokinase n=1 Tax=Penicilliopsis zonata CBS 506.65 TaxID=1073090 RepID=A0A1L9SII7_9EURO|nr:hypothetical protein ASPZODRAFT_166286 [Penicilliopsis zonata CBS 506.65]OJJ47029.1 hypothetical protein ASPZODRAFT_166286 [Penicilliopsis zonata CBS 506.65]